MFFHFHGTLGSRGYFFLIDTDGSRRRVFSRKTSRCITLVTLNCRLFLQKWYFEQSGLILAPGPAPLLPPNSPPVTPISRKVAKTTAPLHIK